MANLIIMAVVHLSVGFVGGYLLRCWQGRNRRPACDGEITAEELNATPTPERLAWLASCAEASKRAEQPRDPNRPLCSHCHNDYARLPFGLCRECTEAIFPRE